MSAPRAQRGMTLVELMIAVAAGVIVLGALNEVVQFAFQARKSSRQSNEGIYQAQFMLQRLVAKARTVAPKRLVNPALANSTGDWFAPTMYCLKGGNRLVETTTSDNSCTGSNVVLDDVLAFSATVPAGGAMDRPVGTLSLTVQSATGPVTLTTSVRLGGGVL